MNRKITYQITKEHNNKTIGQFLKEENFSHQIIVGLKKTPNGILLNDHWAYVNERMHENDQLLLTIMEMHPASDIMPISYPLDIVYEDMDLMVINKAADMPIHPSMGNHENTLANALSHYFKNEDSPFIFRCINRLDRDTTGLTILAKNPLSAAILSRQVANHEIHRTYTAICQGHVCNEGTINAPIARVADSTIERCVDFSMGETAITHYWPITYRQDFDVSLVKLQLETGRTHQIRVHMKHLGYPLIGDFLYNPNLSLISRQALHSSSLDFIHPVTKEKMHFHIPLPRDMERIFPTQ